MTIEQSPMIDDAEIDAADSFELPGAEMSGEELAVEILQAQADEFTCASCFLVRHRSQIVEDDGGLLYCVDCRG